MAHARVAASRVASGAFASVASFVAAFWTVSPSLAQSSRASISSVQPLQPQFAHQEEARRAFRPPESPALEYASTPYPLRSRPLQALRQGGSALQRRWLPIFKGCSEFVCVKGRGRDGYYSRG